MKVEKILIVLALLVAVSSAAQAQVITNVVRAGGATGDRDMIGAFDGSTSPMDTEDGGLKDGNYIFSDRTYVWAESDTGTLGPLNTPLIGSEYIRTFNNDKSDNIDVTYTVTISQLATVWITVDDRIDGGDGQARADAVTAAIADAGTFQDTGLQLHVNGDDADPGRPLSVYAADLLPGDHVFGASQGSNFYIIGAVPNDVTFNPAPAVDAGEGAAVYVGDIVQLSGVISDIGPANGTSEGSPGGVASYYWTQKSGPGTATIDPTGTTTIDPPELLVEDIAVTVTFGTVGMYEIMLQASDGFKDANDIVVITVKDHADEFLIGHWEMEDNLLDSTASANHGEPMADSSPEIAFTDGIDGGRALLLDNPDRNDPNGYVHLGAAPELDIQSVPPEFTATAWFKTTNGSDQIIIGKGGDDDSPGGICWLLMVDSRGVRFLTDDNDDRERPRGPQDDNDGMWHFAAGVSDSWGLRVYVDGVLTAENERGGSYDISGSSQRPGFIGAGTEWDDTEPNGVNNNIFEGVIDDVRVYNYALPLDDVTYDSVLGLASMGPLVASVDAGADIEFNWKPGKVLQLAGVVTDYGIPDVKIITWETESVPVADPAAEATITTPDPAYPEEVEVTINTAGVYVFKLSVVDPDAAEGSDPVSDTVRVTFAQPTCEDVIADGLLLMNDLDGDCYIGLSDLAIILSRWGECNDPEDETGLCEWPPF